MIQGTLAILMLNRARVCLPVRDRQPAFPLPCGARHLAIESNYVNFFTRLMAISDLYPSVLHNTCTHDALVPHLKFSTVLGSTILAYPQISDTFVRRSSFIILTQFPRLS